MMRGIEICRFGKGAPSGLRPLWLYAADWEFSIKTRGAGRLITELFIFRKRQGHKLPAWARYRIINQHSLNIALGFSTDLRMVDALLARATWERTN